MKNKLKIALVLSLPMATSSLFVSNFTNKEEYPYERVTVEKIYNESEYGYENNTKVMNDIKREGTLVSVNSVSVELFSYGSNDRSAKNGGYNHQIGTIIDNELIDNHILQVEIGGLQYIKLIALMFFC